MSLILDSVGYTYGAGTRFAQVALAGVSLEVEPGEMLLVLGATGSGKSTLLRLGAGLLDPTQGTASIDGELYSRDNTRGAVGLIFQDAESQLFADSVLDDVAFGPRNLGFSEEETLSSVEDALVAVGLDIDVYGGRSPFTLSGGEARRAAIAGVLAMRPRYVLADEPTAGLDAPGRAALKRILLELRTRAGIVVVSHAAEEFLGEADRVLVLEGGRPAWSGPAAELIADPALLLDSGLVPPDVLEVQRRATLGGLEVGSYALDPEKAAAILAHAGGWA